MKKVEAVQLVRVGQGTRGGLVANVMFRAVPTVSCREGCALLMAPSERHAVIQDVTSMLRRLGCAALMVPPGNDVSSRAVQRCLFREAGASLTAHGRNYVPSKVVANKRFFPECARSIMINPRVSCRLEEELEGKAMRVLHHHGEVLARLHHLHFVS